MAGRDKRSSKNTVISIRITDDDYDVIWKFIKEHNLSISQIMRKALEGFLSQQQGLRKSRRRKVSRMPAPVR